MQNGTDTVEDHLVASYKTKHTLKISSVQLLSHIWLFVTHALQHARLPCPSPIPGACTNSCLLSRWCHPTILSSVIPFSSCLQSFPASEYFPVSQFFASDDQSIGVSASASVLPMNIPDWFPLGWTGWIALQSKGLSRIFSNTTVQKHQFFSAQLSLWSNSHIHTWLLENCSFDYMNLCQQCLCFLILCLGLSLIFFQGESIF